MYDNGSNGGAVTQKLDGGVSHYTLKSMRIAVQTVSGVEEKNHTRRKMKTHTYQNMIRKYDSIVVSCIGKEEANVKEYVKTIVELFKMSE